MQIQLHTKWLRLLIEFYPTVPPIRRYRVMRPSIENRAGRQVLRRIFRQLRLDEGDPADALLWFAEALPLMIHPAETSVHRIRIQQTLNQTPRILQVFPHGHEGAVGAFDFSPDETHIATAGGNQLRLWDAGRAQGPYWADSYVRL
jgi:WD40 repeat protein